MKLEQCVGDIVFVSFRDPERFREVGFVVKSGHFMVKGFDQFGIWLAHPGLVLVVSEDSKGRPLPPDKHKKSRIEATFLATWDNLEVMMHYPDREGFDFPSEFDKKIGFEIHAPE